MPCPHSLLGWNRLGHRSSGSLTYASLQGLLGFLWQVSTVILPALKVLGELPLPLWFRAPAYNLSSLHLFPTAGRQNAQHEIDGGIPGLQVQSYWCNNRYQLPPFLSSPCQYHSYWKPRKGNLGGWDEAGLYRQVAQPLKAEGKFWLFSHCPAAQD